MFDHGFRGRLGKCSRNRRSTVRCVAFAVPFADLCQIAAPIRYSAGRGVVIIRERVCAATGKPARDGEAVGVANDWPLVGREQELVSARRALADAEVCGLLLTGRAGAGKTRLAKVLLAELADAGART